MKSNIVSCKLELCSLYSSLFKTGVSKYIFAKLIAKSSLSNNTFAASKSNTKESKPCV